MNTYQLKCHSCDVTEEAVSAGNEVVAAKNIGWGYVFDTSNGLTIAYFCPDCFTKAQKLATDLHKILKLDQFHFQGLLK
jgi:hypothetical protein